MHRELEFIMSQSGYIRLDVRPSVIHFKRPAIRTTRIRDNSFSLAILWEKISECLNKQIKILLKLIIKISTLLQVDIRYIVSTSAIFIYDYCFVLASLGWTNSSTRVCVFVLVEVSADVHWPLQLGLQQPAACSTADVLARPQPPASGDTRSGTSSTWRTSHSASAAWRTSAWRIGDTLIRVT